jgi:uncharacterized membrane protein
MARLKAEAGGLMDAFADRAVNSVRDRVENATGRLADYVEGDRGPGLIAAVTGARGMAEGKGPFRSMLGATFAGAREKVAGIFRKGKGKSGGRQKLKVVNIVESIDVGVPVRLAYNQWTQFRDFPTFMKKVENVEQADEQKLNWKAQVFWSHRTWEATIIEQRPDELILWRSKGEKGHVDGAVTFHALTPTLTRVVLVLEYHPQGMFERTGNIWRAQGRRVRLELKHFERHVMAHAVLNADDIEGWRGVIEDGEVVKDHETALETEGREPEAEQIEGDETAEPDDEFAEADDEREMNDEREDVTDESEGAEPADEAEEAEEVLSDNGDRPARRRTATASGSGARARRPAASRSSRTEDRPQRRGARGARAGTARGARQ